MKGDVESNDRLLDDHKYTLDALKRPAKSIISCGAIASSATMFRNLPFCESADIDNSHGVARLCRFKPCLTERVPETNSNCSDLPYDESCDGSVEGFRTQTLLVELLLRRTE